ncbi:MAG: oligosaccharide repeat unit polymerase family protein [archaeon]|nr:oligosaccharide repeat unit polymerase family protein [archaeon]
MKLLDKLEKIDIFNPFIIVFVILAFLAIATPSWTILDELVSPGILLYIYIALGLIFFILGVLFTNFLFKKFLKKDYKESSTSFRNKDNFAIKLSLFEKFSKEEKIILCAVLLGILLQIINLYSLGGIPLFDSSLKAKAATKIWLVSYLIFLPSINILLAKFNRKSYYVLLIIGVLLFAITGYRTTPIAILLSTFITLYYTRDFKLKYQLIFVLLILVILIVVGFIAINAIGTQHWRLNALEIVSYRAGFTLKILERAINRQLMTGGALFYSTLTGFFTSTDPRVLVGQAVLSYNHSITSTIFGPSLLDFGTWGMIIQMFLMGAFLKALHMVKNFKFSIITGIYGVILAQTLIWTETGPTDLVAWIFYLIGFLLLIYVIKSKSNSND